MEIQIHKSYKFFIILFHSTHQKIFDALNYKENMKLPELIFYIIMASLFYYFHMQPCLYKM